MKFKAVSWCKHKVNVPGVPFRDYEKESSMEIYSMDWIRKMFEITGEERFKHWHHSANERSSSSEGFTAKMMGQSKGFPDLIHCGLKLAIEFKLPGRAASKEQLGWLAYFKKIGWHAEIVTSYERFRDIVMGAKT